MACCRSSSESTGAKGGGLDAAVVEETLFQEAILGDADGSGVGIEVEAFEDVGIDVFGFDGD